MIPKREVATNNGQTYFVTSSTAQRTPFFRHERWAKLFLQILYGYRPVRYLLHGFVLMPDHFHVLITPAASLELAVQCLKGGFSFRAKREFAWAGEIWVTGFTDHRIRDDQELAAYLGYIARNPVKAGLVERPEQYAYSSANGSFEVDTFPRWLKPPGSCRALNGAAEAAPLQSRNESPGEESKNERLGEQSTNDRHREQSKKARPGEQSAEHTIVDSPQRNAHDPR
jgi:putative transposase